MMMVGIPSHHRVILIIIYHSEVSVGFDPVNYIVSEGDSTDLTIVRRGDAERPVVVIVTTGGGTATGTCIFVSILIIFTVFSSAGDDYVPLDGVEVTFPPGVFTQTITLDTVPDVPVEGTENVGVVIEVIDEGVNVFEPSADVLITEEGTKNHSYHLWIIFHFVLCSYSNNLIFN